MISVIIPALNEAATIESVVSFALADPHVQEVIVVDDGSVDGTPEKAETAGAMVITSTLLGKGASMEDGLRAARNDIVVYLDGDLGNLRPDLIPRLTQPLLSGQADFVKARFSRQAGRVTMLTAKPFLKLFFPELAHFEQPLGGIIAVRASLLRKFRFENDYGVDIGLLLDAAATGARLAEVDVGHIEHHSQPLEALGEMAYQVLRTLLDRAARLHRLRMSQVHEAEELERCRQADLKLALRKAAPASRLALFDMDGTLLRGRFIVSLAERTNRLAVLARYLDNDSFTNEERTRQIAALFKGVPRALFDETAREAQLMQGAVETVVALRKSGYRVGIVTDSYRGAAEIVRRRVFADFSVAHIMRFQAEKASGELILSPAFTHSRGCQRHPACKVNVMHHLIEGMKLSTKQVLAVGDGENDRCLLQAAGRSVAYKPKSASLRSAADFTLNGPLTGILDLLLGGNEKATA